MKNAKDPKILFYDIETTPIRVWTFQFGKQYLNHKSQVRGDRLEIVTISYGWEDSEDVKTLVWDPVQQNSAEMITEFDKIVEKADICIGKNSDRFDVKHINTQRFYHKLKPRPDWSKTSDDVEKQLRKHFWLPSYSLDYFSNMLGLGGKDKMVFDDWIAIKEGAMAKQLEPVIGREALKQMCPLTFCSSLTAVERNYKAAMEKMIIYNQKDVADTRTAWLEIKPYIIPKFNYSAYKGLLCCRNCGDPNIKPDGSRTQGKTRFLKFKCLKCHSYAGQITEAQANKHLDGKQVVMS